MFGTNLNTVFERSIAFETLEVGFVPFHCCQLRPCFVMQSDML